VQRYRSLTVSIFLYLNGNIGTDDGTGGAACTPLAVIKDSHIISLEIQIIGNRYRLFWAEFDTEGTALAALTIYANRTFQFSYLLY